MEIQQFDGEAKGYFKAEDHGVEAGKMTYTWAGKKIMIIDHTEVNPEYKGKNVGKQMVMAAVALARENGIKIIPLCPFAKSVFDRNEDIRDIL